MVNHIKSVVPVNMSFNKSVKTAIEKYGIFEGYLYLDSGVEMQTNDDIGNLYDLFKSSNHGMVTAQVDNDFGWCWFGMPDKGFYIDRDALIPVGRACNLHAQIFSNKLLDYYGNVLPDIFRSYCTESTFSFVCSALKLKWAISGKVRLHHEFTIPTGSPNDGDGLDGHSIAFRAPHGTWDDVYGSKSMKEICEDSRGTDCGFGYEELRGIKMHNSSCFKGYECNNEELKVFIKDNLYLPPAEYADIEEETFECSV